MINYLGNIFIYMTSWWGKKKKHLFLKNSQLSQNQLQERWIYKYKCTISLNIYVVYNAYLFTTLINVP